MKVDRDKLKDKFPVALWITAAAMILFLGGNSFYFAFDISVPLIRADEWRHLHMYLVPWYQGEFEFSALWQDHHPQPLTALLLIANAELFQLRMDYETIFALGFSVVTCSVLLWRILKSFEGMSGSVYLPVTFVLSSAVVFSLTATIVYTWSLVTLGHIATCFALLTLVSIDHVSSEENAKRAWLISLFVFLLLVSFSSGAKLYVYSAIVVLAAQAALLRSIDRVKIIGWVIAGLVFQRIFLSAVGNVGYDEVSAAGSLFSRIGYLPEYLEYIGVGLMSGWVNLKGFTGEFDLDATVVTWVGFAVLFLYLFTLWLYVRSGLILKTVIPGVFVFVALATGTAAALVRFNPEVESPVVAEVPRYYLLYFTGVVACIWVWFYCLARSVKRLAAAVMAVLLVSTISYLQYFSSTSAWIEAPHAKRRAERALQQIMINWDSQDYTERPRFSVLKSNRHLYEKGMPFLKAHKLSIFAEDFPGNEARHLGQQ